MPTEPATALRPLAVADGEAVFDNVFADGDPDPHGYVLDGPRPAERGEGAVVVGAQLELTDRASFAVVDGDGELVGLAWLIDQTPPDEVQLALVIGPRYRRLGHAGRTLRLLVNEAESSGRVPIGVVKAGNTAIEPVLREAGFEPVQPEGVPFPRTWHYTGSVA